MLTLNKDSVQLNVMYISKTNLDYRGHSFLEIARFS